MNKQYVKKVLKLAKGLLDEWKVKFVLLFDAGDKISTVQRKKANVGREWVIRIVMGHKARDKTDLPILSGR